MPADFPSLAALLAEAETLILARFAEAEALELGRILTDLATGHGFVINIRTPDRVLFHAALPGAAPFHDAWVARKSSTAFFFHDASLTVGQRNREKGDTLAKHGLDPAHYADHGGAVPIRVEGVGLVAVVTVSGLPQLDDHALAVEGLRALKTGL